MAGRKKVTARAEVRGVFEKEAGSDIWWIRYTDSTGRYKREKVGRWSDAIKLYQKRKTEARLGVKMPENLKHKGVTFQDLADAILVHVEHKDYKDKRNVISRVKRICEHFGSMEASKMLPEDITAWLAKNTSSPATSNRYKAVFSLIFREAIRNRKVSFNPARLVSPARERNERIRWLQHDERARLLRVVGKHYPEHLPELIISLGSGMRLSEQYGLKWKNIDFRGQGQIHLSDTKNGTSRSIPMAKDVRTCFEALKKARNGDAVFNYKAPGDWWDDVRKKAEIEDYVWHCNRHTFCTVLSEKGVALKVIQKLAGHKTIAMTARYAKATDTALSDAVALL